MSNKVVINKLPAFAGVAEAVMDKTLAKLGTDIINLSIIQAPHLHGQLRSSGKVVRKGVGEFEVEYTAPYAEYQEAGARKDGSHRVKNYTEAGTKAHYLKDPAELLTERTKLEARFKLAGESAKI